MENFNLKTETFGRVIRATVSVALILVFNLLYYQLFEYSFMHLDIVDEHEFNTAPSRDGSVSAYTNVFSQFSYAPFRSISDVTFKKFFNLLPTGNALKDAIAASKKTRAFYRHEQMGELYPFVPDSSIEIASRRSVVCGSYARTTLAALKYMGHVARIIYLNGHVTLEVYDFDKQSWIYVDPNYGAHFTDANSRPLSITEFQTRMRGGATIRIHSMDASTDDPHLVDGEPGPGYVSHASLTKYLSNLRKNPSEPYLNGHTAFEDGYGYNYRRKAIVFARAPAHVVVLRDEQMSPAIRFGGFGYVAAINLLLFTVLLVWVFKRRRGTLIQST